MKLDGYAELEKLHESHRTKIYRAVRKSDQRRVLLKINTDSEVDNNKIKINNEFEIGKILNGEYSVEPLSMESSDQNSILVFCDDQMTSLDKVLLHPCLEFPHFLKISIEITKAVEFIHSKSIIHKDINPSNIIVNDSLDEIKLIDFEFSTRMKREEIGIKSVEVLDGTLAYISPEQTGRINRKVDYRSDFYSLGVSFYQLLTGKPPFPQNDPMELVHCHIAKKPRPIHEVNPFVPEALSNVVMKLISKTAEERYQSASGLRADLEECERQYKASKQIIAFPLAEHDFSIAVHIPQKLYGRSEEIDTLFGSFERIGKGTSEIVFIAGYSGVGKTSVVNEIHKPVTEKNGYFASGKFSQLQKDIPYYAITQAFNKLCDYLIMEKPDVLENWRRKILDAVGHNGQVILDVIPRLERIIGKQPRVTKVGITETQNRFEIYFKRFVNRLSSKDHPLVLFIDDLQWGDLASINLLKRIMLEDEIKYLLILVAYRDNEVDQSHPLFKMQQELEQSRINFSVIQLENLKITDIAALLSDTLKATASDIQPLSDLIFQKTGGNPFFTHQFIQMLFDETLLRFDTQVRRWAWDINQIADQKITSNVVEMMSNKIMKLPKETTQALHAAACIGDQFDLHLLNRILEKDEKETLSAFGAALQEGLIVPLNDDYKNEAGIKTAVFKFSHDRIHQAAYSITDGLEKQKIHLKTGRLLWDHSPEHLLEENILNIVEQLGHSLELVDDPKERQEIAKLYLIAGKKAKKAVAFKEALSYLTAGRKCLTENSFQKDYELSFSLYREASEAAFLCGEYSEMEASAGTALTHAHSLRDEAQIRKIQIQAHIARNNRKRAIQIALEFLRKLGIHLNRNPSPPEIGKALSEMHAIWADQSIQAFIELPIMQDENLRMAMQIMAATTSAAFVASPGLMILLILKQVELSLEKGNTPESSYSYVFYGVVLCGVAGDIEKGYQFGLLATKLLERLEDMGFKAKVDHVFNDLIRPWKRHIKSSLDPLINNYEIGLTLGDIEFAAYSAHIYVCYLFSMGENLHTVKKEIVKYTNAIEAINQNDTLSWNRIYWQVVLNLMGSSDKPWEISGEVHEERTRLPVYTEANDKMALSYFYLNKCILNYLFHRFTDAVENADLAEPQLDGATGKYTVAVFYFYDSLSRLALFEDRPPEAQRAIMAKVTENQVKLKSWAEHAPMNFQHKYALVEAEKKRVSGRWEAIPSYEAAMAGAKQNGFIQEEALSYELAGRFYLVRNMPKIAKTYLTEAYDLYKKWGAKAKCDHLENTYFELLSLDRHRPNSSGGITAAQLDQQSIFKASQAISREVFLDQLLGNLTSIVIENAGADKGVLIIGDDQEARIQASKSLEPDRTETMQNILIQESDEIPLSIVQTVIQTQKMILIKDALRSDYGFKSEYIRRNRPKSVLCMPIIHQSHLVGAIYIENSQLTNVFSEKRRFVLDILLSQAAISIENAKLFEKLNQERDYSSNLIDNSPSLICGVAPDGTTTFINPAIESITGYAKDEIVGRNWWALFYPGDEYEQVETLFEKLKRGEVTDYEMNLTCKNGEKRSIVWKSMTQKDHRNQILEIIGFGNDITSRKQAEEERQKYAQRLAIHVDQTPLGVIEWDLDFRVVQWNRAAERIFGYSREEALGRHAADIIVPESARGRVDRIWTDLISKKGGTVNTNENITKSGKVLTCDWYNTTLIDKKGVIMGVASLVQDTSEAKKLEKQLQQSQKMEAIGTLAGGIAHDFNNILSPLIGHTELLQADIPSDSPLQNHVDEILRAAFRSRDLVKQILTFCRFGRREVKPMKLQPVVKEVVKLIRASIPATIDIHDEISSECGIVNGDPTQIHQVVMNLCANAYHAMESTGGKLQIKLQQTRLDSDRMLSQSLAAGEYALLKVSDTGSGIQKDILGKVFDPYFTTKDKDKGTGLGLSVVHGIVKNCKGDIQIYSEPGKGTEVHVYLPILSGKTIQEVAAEAVPAEGGTERILLVDDEEAIADVEQQILERFGYRVTACSASTDALVLFHQNSDDFDIVITDMTMPNMTGTQFAAEIRKIRPNIPIIICSGFSNEINEENSNAMGIQGFLMKPVLGSVMARMVRKVLDEAKESK